MPRCAVYHCTNKGKNIKPKTSFFRFPKQNPILNQWIKACRRKDEINTRTERVCLQHFKEEDFANYTQFRLGNFKPILNRSAVPKLHLRPENEKNPERRERYKSRCIRKNALERLRNLSPNKTSNVNPQTQSTNQKKPNSETQNLGVIDTNKSNNIQPAQLGNLNPLTVATQELSNCNTTQHKENNNENRSIYHPAAETIELMKKKICHLHAQNKELTNAKLNIEKKLTDYKKTVAVMELKVKSFENQLVRSKQMTAKWKVQWVNAVKNLKRQTDSEHCTRILKSIFSSSQIRYLKTNKRVRWLRDDITKAIALRKISKKAYYYVRNELKIPLPGLSTLKRWTSTCLCDPRIVPLVLPVNFTVMNIPETVLTT